jgi:hypothetical protein
MQLSTRELLKELEAMYDQHADSMILHEEFRAREWRKDKTFSDYMHEKIVLGNRVPIEEKQLLGYIIDGIPHWGLRSNTVSGVSTKEELRARLENVEHWDKRNETRRGAGRYSRDQDSKAGTSKPEESKGSRSGGGERKKGNCFNCGLPNHVSTITLAATVRRRRWDPNASNAVSEDTLRPNALDNRKPRALSIRESVRNNT